MPDVQLDKFGNGGNRPYPVKCDAVAGMHFQTHLMAFPRRLLQPPKLRGRLLSIAIIKRIAVGARMKLHDLSPHGLGYRKLHPVRIDEQRHTDVSTHQLAHIGCQLIVLRSRIKTAFGGEFLPAFRYQTTGVRFMLEGDLQHLFRCRHLEVERQRQIFHQPVDVGIGNVPAIFPQMRRYAIRPGLGRNFSSAHGVRMLPTTRITDGGHVINVNAEAQDVLAHGTKMVRQAGNVNRNDKRPSYAGLAASLSLEISAARLHCRNGGQRLRQLIRRVAGHIELRERNEWDAQICLPA